MEKFVYTASIIGDNVHQSRATLYVIDKMNKLKKVRKLIKKYYFVEFEKEPTFEVGGYYWEFDNITDTRDITLIVERVDII